MCADCTSEVIVEAPAEPENIMMACGFSETACCAAVSAPVAVDWLSMTCRFTFSPLMPPVALMLSMATSAPAAPGPDTEENGPDRSEIKTTLNEPPADATLAEPVAVEPAALEPAALPHAASASTGSSPPAATRLLRYLDIARISARPFGILGVWH